MWSILLCVLDAIVCVAVTLLPFLRPKVLPCILMALCTAMHVLAAAQSEYADAVLLRCSHQLTLEVCIAMVEEQHQDFAPVILINDTSTDVYEVLGSQTRAWGNTAICTMRHMDGDACLHRVLPASRDDAILSTAR